MRTRSRLGPIGDIVIYTSLFDPHADVIINKLAEVGIEPIRLNSQDIPLDIGVEVRFGDKINEKVLHLFKGSREIDFSTISSFWWRKPDNFGFPESLSEQELAFAKMEMDAIISGLFYSVNCRWVNHPLKNRAASAKIEQLQRAKQHGFEIPTTLITNDPFAVKDLMEACTTGVVFKVLTDPFLAFSKVAKRGPGGLFYNTDESTNMLVAQTTLLTEEEKGELDKVTALPGMFQEYVPKKYELRITIIGEKVFPAKILSQESEKTKIDWRNYSVDIPYEPVKLDEVFLAKCVDFVRSYDLNYSALDFIVTDDDRFVFLENNPNGQFLFIENLVPELKMADALVDLLAKAPNPIGVL